MAGLLVVDDDRSILSLTARILERAGHSIIAAAGGGPGIAAFALHEPRIDAVLMDVDMPEVDGLTAFQRIRRQRPDVPFVFVTGSAALLPEVVLAEPRVALLTKPYAAADLVATVDQVLAMVAKPELAPWETPASWDCPASRLLTPPAIFRTRPDGDE